MRQHTAWIPHLEQRFRHLSQILYDTDVDPAVVDAEVTPLLDANVRFTDPWQQASGREKYRLGMAGFHAMFRFKLRIHQVSVHLAADKQTARILVDGVMDLQPFGPRWTYPLRTMLVYDVVLTATALRVPDIRITAHEEMWSLGDMLAAAQMTGHFYSHVFRPAFSRALRSAAELDTSRRCKDSCEGSAPIRRTPLQSPSRRNAAACARWRFPWTAIPPGKPAPPLISWCRVPNA